MSAGRQRVLYTILDAKATTWIWNTIAVKDFRNCVVKIWTASSANLTVKAVGAIASFNTPDTAPDFSASQSVANNWDYLQMIDLSDWSPINWTTWFVASWTDKFKLYEININGLDFINFNVTARSAWSVTAEIQLTTNL